MCGRGSVPGVSVGNTQRARIVQGQIPGGQRRPVGDIQKRYRGQYPREKRAKEVNSQKGIIRRREKFKRGDAG